MRIFNRREGMGGPTAGNQKGQGLVEYALLLLLMAIVVVAMVKAIGITTNNTYNTIANSVMSAAKP